MKLISKSVVDQLSTQMYTKESLTELLGRKPEHIAGYVQHKNQVLSHGLMAITEGLGNVYMDEQGFTPLKELSTWEFTWDVKQNQIPTIRFTRDATVPADVYAQFDIYLEARYFAPDDIFVFENA